MTDRAAIITGASSGIGLEIARVLGQEGHRLTIAARRPDKLEAAAEQLRAEGFEVLAVAGALQDEDAVARVVSEHRERYGRLDVLVNNAGVGSGAAVADIDTKRLDLQLGLNLRSTILFYREAVGLLREAGRQHRSALVVNTASITAKLGKPGLSVYAATKAGIVNWTASMHQELSAEGIKSTALCPGYVDTPMTDHAKGRVAAEAMMTPSDIAESVRFLLRVSPACCVPEIPFVRPGDPTA
ncbi:SDR family oxidoreductase [Patulibacter sp.]|uniref:SDR family oxidoreductase n=1 Tax=Patulibacter sp. TaxID=1912859 RepID=UPI00271BDD28|nr:SDR family oxidoreductase [Patulibacter sp.]MDO9407799.1 SDR family oxidoreductase [Patulibacter sp.]